MNARITVPLEKLDAFCRRWQVVELSLFGSILREDFRPDSDIDVLVSFQPGSPHTLFDMVRMKDELTILFGRKVDLVSRRGIESSRNHIRKNEILNSAEVLYAA
ncbi:MAG: nucleotidyltransferase family protein [Blastocatellia bacterium]|nr:nucleotidyltransferase family protein [Blastocatellia bacterium]